MIEEIKRNMNRYDNGLSIYACKNSNAIRLIKENDDDIRNVFFRDIDRIIYSLPYTRYIDKTQVFSNNSNDNISRRMTHVQMVSKIARTIGRALRLNEDLIEAAALGHDLGHTPFGHVGEKILNDISLENNEGYFNHNIQSVRILKYIENNGNGNNISIQVLDAIMCHNGEFLEGEYYPDNKSVDDFLNQYNNSYKIEKYIDNLRPMTLEGCVVRLSDIIGYIGRDIEDAIRLNVIKIEDIPIEIRKILGNSNREIIDTVVMDVIKNSINKPYIKLSPNIYKAILDLKKFNYKHIYEKSNDKTTIEGYEEKFRTLFDLYLKQLNNKEEDCDIYNLFLKDMSQNYLEYNSNARKVIDFIAGMTDDFLISQYSKYF